MSKANVILNGIVSARAAAAVDATGKFDKAAMTADFHPMELREAVGWQEVVASVSDALGEPLVSFSDDARTPDGQPYDPEIDPRKFLPGRGRATTGYARVSALPQPVVMASVERRYNMAAGQLRGLESLAMTCQAAGLPITWKPVSLPQLTVQQ